MYCCCNVKGCWSSIQSEPYTPLRTDNGHYLQCMCVKFNALWLPQARSASQQFDSEVQRRVHAAMCIV